MYTKIFIIATVCVAVLFYGFKHTASPAVATTVADGSDTADYAVNPEPVAVQACLADTGINKIICLANAFKAQLTPEQLKSVQLGYSVTDAQRWSNLPPSFLRGSEAHVGLRFGLMTKIQIQYAKALLKAASGSDDNEGWDELQQLINAEQYLQKSSGGGDMFGAGQYYISFLGIPAKTGTFELQYGGHHTAFSNTYKDGALSGSTPSFRGVEPFATFTWHGKNNQPIQQEQAAMSAMLSSLTAAQQATAKLSGTYADLLAGPHKDGQFPAKPSGIKCSELNASQKTLVLQAINTYVSDLAGADAKAVIKKYTAELDNTYISFSGTTGLLTRNDYVRLDGPSLWIEYSCQGGIVLPPTHPHSVWRDKKTDYGGN